MNRRLRHRVLKMRDRVRRALPMLMTLAPTPDDCAPDEVPAELLAGTHDAELVDGDHPPISSSECRETVAGWPAPLTTSIRPCEASTRATRSRSSARLVTSQRSKVRSSLYPVSTRNHRPCPRRRARAIRPPRTPVPPTTTATRPSARLDSRSGGESRHDANARWCSECDRGGTATAAAVCACLGERRVGRGGTRVLVRRLGGRLLHRVDHASARRSHLAVWLDDLPRSELLGSKAGVTRHDDEEYRLRTRGGAARAHVSRPRGTEALHASARPTTRGPRRRS